MASVSRLELLMPLAALILVTMSWLLHRRRQLRVPMTLNETGANVGIFLVWRLIFFPGGLALQFFLFSYISRWIPWKLPTASWVIVLAAFIADFCYYWKHRWEHQLNVLWAQHAVHHSSEEYNLSTSIRLPWVGSYLNWIFFVPALGLGFSATQILIGHQIVLAYQYLIHTEYVRQLGWLERVLNTPSHHRAHHGRNGEYLDKNYGGILIIWDRLFGTFTKEVAVVDYGTVHPMRSKNPLTINLQPWCDLANLAKELPNNRSRARLLLTSPAETLEYIERSKASN